MRTFLLVGSLLVVSLAACGGKTDDDLGATGAAGSGGGSAGAGGGKAGSGGATAGAGGTAAGSGGATAGAGGAPDGCLVATQQPGPFAVIFRLKNTTSAPLVLWQECEIDKAITSCQSGFTTPLVTSGACTIACDDPSMGCIACGACASQGLTLAPGEAKEVQWSGNTFKIGMKNGCACHDTFVAPAAHYQINVPIYPETPSSGPFGPKPDKLRTVVQDFVLPAPGGIVEVSLAP